LTQEEKGELRGFASGVVAAVQVAKARGLVVVVLADPITVAGTVVTRCSVYGTFLSRGRGESRFGDEWAPTWMPTMAGTINVVSGKQGFAAVKGSGVVMWSHAGRRSKKIGDLRGLFSSAIPSVVTIAGGVISRQRWSV